LCAALDDAATRTCVEAERAMNRTLHGSCHVPVAALARLDGDDLSLEGLVGSAGDGRIVRAQGMGTRADPEALGFEVARRLLADGAAEFLPGPE
jgi:hydroxymethylbilane synthase